MSLKEKLVSLGFSLPDVSVPGGNYASVNVRGNIAYIAIQFPIFNGTFCYQGRLGTEICTEEGTKAMELCALNVLAQVDKKIGIPNLVGLNHFDMYYRSAPDWDDAPKIANGASDLYVKVLDEKGRHSRAIFGVENLPRNFSVGLSATFTV